MKKICKLSIKIISIIFCIIFFVYSLIFPILSTTTQFLQAKNISETIKYLNLPELLSQNENNEFVIKYGKLIENVAVSENFEKLLTKYIYSVVYNNDNYYSSEDIHEILLENKDYFKESILEQNPTYLESMSEEDFDKEIETYLELFSESLYDNLPKKDVFYNILGNKKILIQIFNPYAFLCLVIIGIILALFILIFDAIFNKNIFFGFKTFYKLNIAPIIFNLLIFCYLYFGLFSNLIKLPNESSITLYVRLLKKFSTIYIRNILIIILFAVISYLLFSIFVIDKKKKEENNIIIEENSNSAQLDNQQQ